jgi:hypothetical protein
MSRSYSYTDDELRRAWATATSQAELMDALGLSQGGPQNRALRAHLSQLGLSVPNGNKRPRHRVSVTTADLYQVVCSVCGELEIGRQAAMEELRRKHLAAHPNGKP